MTSEKLIDFQCWFLLACGKIFKHLNHFLMRFNIEFPVGSNCWIFFLTSVSYHNRSKMWQLGRSKSIIFIIFGAPTIKSYFVISCIDIFLDDVAYPPVSLTVLGIDKIINIVDLPKLLCHLFPLYFHLLFCHFL